MLKIYNTLVGKKEIFKTRKSRMINMFVCGPTVYDFSHIGHARTYIVFDCFAKYLKRLGLKVFYLQNITDIDDKIILRAKEKGVSPKDIAENFTKKYLQDMKAIDISSVNEYAKATDYIKEIISQVKRLLTKGYAYRLDNGIYYDIGKFKDYGKLSKRTVLQAEDATSRIDYSKNKKNRGDFCLWKFNEHKDEPSWPSPFGLGRPGWHIEDTAITEKFFGVQYDIHGGGRELIFPHHDAEIAQIEAISGKKPLARYWMHTGFLTIRGEKMSKSLKNFVTIDDFLKKYSHRLLRFWVAKNLWRSPLDYSESAMIEAKSGLERIEEFLRKINHIKSTPTGVRAVSRETGQFNKVKNIIIKTKNNFYKSLNDDFNTPRAFAAIFDLIKDANKNENSITKNQSGEIYKFFEELNKIFGIIDFKSLEQSNVPKELKKLLQAREKHRKSKEWEEADKIRKEIEKEVLPLIALNARGSFRDAESLLDKCVSFTAQDRLITLSEVKDLLGIVEVRQIASFIDFILQKNAKEAIIFINSLMDQGVDLQEFAKTLVFYLRQFLLLKISPDLLDSQNSGFSDEEIEKMKEQMEKLTEKEIQNMLEIFIEAENKMKYATILQLPLELAIVDLAHKES